jgi:hypothetical protein
MNGDTIYKVGAGLLGMVALVAVVGLIVAGAAFGGTGDAAKNATTAGGSLSGDCDYDKILASASAGKSEGEATASGAPQQVPQQYIQYYVSAAEKLKLEGCGPSILAGIHSIESGFGGDDYSTVNSAGAGGPFQFLESTWASEAKPPGGCGGTWPSYGVEKGACAAANYLKNSGAPKNWKDAIYAYNHADWYVYGVVLQAKHFAAQSGGLAAPDSSPQAKTSKDADNKQGSKDQQ